MEEIIEDLGKAYHEYRRVVNECSHYLWEIQFGHIEISDNRKHYSEYWTHEYLFKMYNVICAYLEILKLNDYLNDFKKKFHPILSDSEKALQFSFYPIEDGTSSEQELELLLEWDKYLSPFELFNSNKDERQIKRVIDYLESTNEILKITGTIIRQEEDINKVVREVAKFYFNGVVGYSQGYFRHQFKNYRPDLIIKECGVAVEYKLIRNNKDVGTKLDELIVDAKRYSGNSLNGYCIAVFCLSKSVIKTEREISNEWKKMRFPKNWKLIVIKDVEIKTK